MMTKNIELLDHLASNSGWVLLVGEHRCMGAVKENLAKRGWAEIGDRVLAPSGHMTRPMRITEAGRKAIDGGYVGHGY
jgi:hypothetical protein